MVPLVLIIIAVVLIFINIKFGDKKNSFLNYINSNGKLNVKLDFKKQLNNKTSNYSSEQNEIGQIRKDIAESLTELQKDIINLSNRIDLLEKGKSIKIDKVIKDDDEINENKVYNRKKVKSNLKNNDKVINQNKNFKEDIKESKKEILNSEKSNDTKGSFQETFKVSVNKKTKKQKNLKYDGVINDISSDSKSVRIKKMLDEGVSIDKICENLSVGKGEVLLVKGLYKK